MPELSNLSIAKIAAGLGGGAFSARDVVESYIARAKGAKNNSFLEVFESRAIADAEAIDARLKQGERLPLAGVPLAVKDNILVEGHRASAASKILENYEAAYTATTVSRLVAAGAIIIGRTNMDEFAMGSSTESSAFGPTKNPYDESRVPGGSSGGSAAAVAEDSAVAALGSDTGGSIRQPAALCGVVGFKPTYSRVSRHGLIAMASSLDQVGSLSKNVEDAATLYKVYAGFDRLDSTSSPHPVDPMNAVELKGLRVGVPKEYFSKGLSEGVRGVVKQAIKKLEQAGADVKEISLPHAMDSLSVYYIVMPAEVSANLARFDGLRYGACPVSAASEANLRALYDEARSSGFGKETKRRILVGTYVLSHGYYDAYYVKAQKVRRLIRNDFADAFASVDVIVGPTTPSVAFPIGEHKDPIAMYLEDVYTVAINLAGLPAISIPAGWEEQNGKRLPVGFQLIGKWFDEANLLGYAHTSEAAFQSV